MAASPARCCSLGPTYAVCSGGMGSDGIGTPTRCMRAAITCAAGSTISSSSCSGRNAGAAASSAAAAAAAAACVQGNQAATGVRQGHSHRGAGPMRVPGSCLCLVSTGEQHSPCIGPSAALAGSRADWRVHEPLLDASAAARALWRSHRAKLSEATRQACSGQQDAELHADQQPLWLVVSELHTLPANTEVTTGGAGRGKQWLFLLAACVALPRAQ